MNKIRVFKLDPEAKTPTRNLDTDAGLDLYALHDEFIRVGQTAKIKTGVAIEIPKGYVGRISDRSGMAGKGLIVGAGVIDAGYSGDHTVVLHNFSHKLELDPQTSDLSLVELKQYKLYDNNFEYQGYKVKKGDKIAQLVIYPVETPQIEVISELWTSERGNTGWGSSGS